MAYIIHNGTSQGENAMGIVDPHRGLFGRGRLFYGRSP